MGLGILKGVRVLDKSTTFAGALATMWLAEQGADVVALSRHEDDYLMRNKRLLMADDLPRAQELHQVADLVVEDDPEALSEERPPGQIQCIMTPFSQEDEAMAKVWVPQGCVEAYMGLFEPPVGRAPSFTSFPLLGVATAAHAVAAIMGALVAWVRGSEGQRVFVAQSDVAYALLELAALFTQKPPKSWPTLQWAATPFISSWQTSDKSWIYVHAGLAPHARRLKTQLTKHVPMLQERLDKALNESVLQDPTTLGSYTQAMRVHKALRDAFASRSKLQWVEWLQDAGLCVVPVNRSEAWRTSLSARESYFSVVDGQLMTARQVHVDAVSAPKLAGLQVDEPVDRAKARFKRALNKPKGRSSVSKPLEGLKVLDLTQVIAGPAACRVLAEFGAEVHKVDNPYFQASWAEAFHVAFNAGKSLETIDLKTTTGHDQFWAMVKALKPDVVLHNYRPGAAEKMGLAKEDFERVVPNVVYTHLTAYGTQNIWKGQPGWEQTVQAATGMQSTYGGEDSPELYPLAINDLCTGVLGAYATLLGLYHRELTGEGSSTSTSLASTATMLMAGQQCGGHRYAQGQKARGVRPLHHIYKTKDGWLLLWVKQGAEALLSQVAGLRGWSEEDLAKRFESATTQQWVSRFEPLQDTRQCLVVPRRGFKEVFSDPMAVRRGLVQRQHHEGIGELTQTRAGWSMEGTPMVELAQAKPREQTLEKGKSFALTQLAGWVGQQTVGVATLVTRRKSD